MKNKKTLVVFSGAGMSAESGIKTFRDTNGLWEEYKIEDVATPQAFAKNPALVLEFYNQRRKQVIAAKPNKGHLILAELEDYFDVKIVTQNIDDLHERAGSSNVLHLHGEIMKSRSSLNPNKIFDIKGSEIKLGEKAPDGSQLRPHIVWFGEEVPQMQNAINIAQQAEILLIIGTSLNVYPAASLIQFVDFDCKVFLIDPHANEMKLPSNIRIINQTAVNGLETVRKELLKSI